MEDLLAARLQMAFTLGFHIIFAVIGMVMPFLMAYAHWKWLRTGENIYKNITKAWSRGVAIFFATGAVSGTVLSFELGLLFPGFMKHAGPIIGMPFSLEGTAFFIEAIAIGVFLYGWDRIPKWIHWGSGMVVGISGVMSGILVVAANGWMNSPTGFDWVEGQALNVDPVAAMLNPAWFTQALHMTLAAFMATGFGVAGVHALMLLRDRNSRFHRKSMHIAMGFAAVAALLQPFSGDLSAKDIAIRQPEKLAAMESLFHTAQPAALIIGGIPDTKAEKVRFAIHIPNALSYLAHGDFSAEVKGLDAFPENERPPVFITHISFQLMVGIGFFLMALGIAWLLFNWKWKRLREHTWMLRLTALAAPLGFLAVEAGWTVTEVGRQPWIVYRVMRTADTVTPMPGVQYFFYLFVAIYLLLAVLVSWLMIRQIRMVPQMYEREEEV
jgi:cytochrome d ubiquinol oxidase subunit I